ncbi:unnamed protein product [Rhizophagus irregularis]|uniref:Uncharacterized protein n=1 Tax=Rhizophagus irregularis TaxID=588596 RepID=A0A916A157_9GLOM|nr:unnamed protein product [Rhizophagus irregularis]CAB5395167.1 unnamed protein product [Rhizophagus irregularis]
MKILRQNIKILSKLDIIISNQKALENRVSKVEESVNKNSDNNQGDEEYIKQTKHRSAWGSLASKVKDIIKDNYSYSDNDEIEASQEAEETNKGVDEAEEVDEVEEEFDEAEEVLQEEEENEIREEDKEEGRRIYISSTDEEIKERMRRLKKQYKK